MLPAAAGCRRAAREPLVTYFNAEFGLSLRYPASWKGDQAQQDGVWYRYFLGPAAGPKRQPSVSVTLLAGPLDTGLDQYAQSYLAGNTVTSSRDERRQWARGRAYEFASSDGATRYALLLLEDADAGRVLGLYVQAPAQHFDEQRGVIDEMSRSLTLERPERYPAVTHEKYGFAIGLPASWRETQHFSGGGTLLIQFLSPPIAADRRRETVHASLTVTVEPLAAGAGLESFYQATRRKLGEAFKILSHEPWRDGYVDVMRTETSIATARVKRFYRASAGRGYTLAFEAREDIYQRVSKWCDIIAGTLKTGPEVAQP